MSAPSFLSPTARYRGRPILVKSELIGQTNGRTEKRRRKKVPRKPNFRRNHDFP